MYIYLCILNRTTEWGEEAAVERSRGGGWMGRLTQNYQRRTRRL